ncbi:MAG: hypothetical protein ACTHK3_03345 [Solirubrobacterales bacterium]
MVNYHLKVLAAEGKIEVVAENDAGQKVYGVVLEPRTETGVVARSLMLGFLDATWATMTERHGQFVDEPLFPYRRQIVVDDQGWREALAVTLDALGKYERIFRDTATRNQTSGDHQRNVIVCLVSVTEPGGGHRQRE